MFKYILGSLKEHELYKQEKIIFFQIAGAQLTDHPAHFGKSTFKRNDYYLNLPKQYSLLKHNFKQKYKLT